MQEDQANNIEESPQSDLDKFVQILGKPVQFRSPKQISLLVQYASQNKGLTELMSKFSQKFIKIILMKHAMAVCANKNTLITKEGSQAANVYIILYGKMLLNTKTKDILDDQSIYQKLGKAACDQVRQNNKLKRKKMARRMSIDFGIQQGNFSRATKTYPPQDLHEIQIAGVRDRSVGTKYLYDVITQVPSLLLEIPMSGFLQALFTYYDQKVNSLYQKIHRMPCFQSTDRDKIQNFIMCLSQKKQKKGNYIYKQNDPATSLYILISGEVKLTKQSNLFVQNPNNLYANRVDLMIQRKDELKNRARHQAKLQQIKKAEAILPYADLSLMYNFQPKKKIIQISQISSFGIFGTQQFIQNKTRQTNAVCNTIQVIYYQISMEKIKQIFGQKMMPDFMKGLKQQVKQKVLHRQLNYANTINFENSANLNYFYFDGDKQKQYTKKFRISKINSKLIDSSPIQQKYKSMDQKNSITPEYTAFNFNKLKSASVFSPVVKTPEKTKQKQKRINNPQLRRSRQSNHDSDEEGTPVKANKQQIKIMNITHTWKLIKNKVDAQLVKSQKISPVRYIIDVNDPLIDNKFLTNLDKEKRRVERKIRKQRITLGQSRALSTVSKNGATF